MTRLNWGTIRSGAEFEGLTRTIVHFEDPTSTLFGRPGKDGGQDARSGDGKTVFQAKYIGSASASKALDEARAEAVKIAKYKAPGHSRFEQWKDVTSWKLSTNALFNTNDDEKWQAQIVPLFKGLGLVATYWSQGELDALVTNYPEVERAYFSGKTRLFLSLPEARAQMAQRDIFLERDSLVDFVGRSNELRDIVEFAASTSKYLILHGPGGVGKSRLMLEGATEAARAEPYQVLWANTVTLQRSDDWFSSIVPEQATLLMLDEPSDPNFLQVLAEQLTGRASKWKVLITVRTPRDPVLSTLRSPDLIKRVRRECEIKPLPLNQSQELCLTMIESGSLSTQPAAYKESASNLIASSFRGFPMWQALAVRLLEKDGRLDKLPKEADELAQRYVAEIVDQQDDFPAVAVLSLLRWLSILGTIDRNSERVLELLRLKTGLAGTDCVSELIASLVRRRALNQRGVRDRLIELRPDVIRDYLLLEWLVLETGQEHLPVSPSAAANELVGVLISEIATGTLGDASKRTLFALGRTEVLQALSGAKVDLLTKIFQGLMGKVDAMPRQARLDFVEALESVASLRPRESLEVCKKFRSIAAEQRESQLLGKLGSFLFAASTGSSCEDEQLGLLQELYEIAKLESINLPKQAFSRDSSAIQVFSRVLTGRPGYWDNYTKSVERFVFQLVKERLKGASHQADAVLGLVLAAVLDTGRETRSWDGNTHTMTLTTVYVLPNHPFWETRVRICSHLREILENATADTDARRTIWKTLSAGRASLRRNAHHYNSDAIRTLLLDELRWAKQRVNWEGILLEELAVARELWDWDLQFADDPEIRALAESLEEGFCTDPLVAEFGLAFGRLSLRSDRLQVLRTLAANVATYEKTEEVDAFFDRALRYLSVTAQEPWRISTLAALFGQQATENKLIGTLLEQGLGMSPPPAQHNYYLDIARGYILATRQSAVSAALPLLIRLNEFHCNVQSKLKLIAECYQYAGSADPGLTSDEVAWLRQQRPLFAEWEQTLQYLHLVAQTAAVDLAGALTIFDEVLPTIPSDVRLKAYSDLLDALDHLFHDEPGRQHCTFRLRDWLLNKLVENGDPDKLPGSGFFHLERLVRRCGGLSPGELVDLFIQRQQFLQDDDGIVVLRLNGSGERLSSLVSTVTADNSNDPDLRAGCEKLLTYLENTYFHGFVLEPLIMDIDPGGLILPGLVYERIEGAPLDADITNLSQIAGAYSVGCPAWDTIANAALARSRELDPKSCRLIYGTLVENGDSWCGAIGQVPTLFVDRTELARTRLASAQSPEAEAFWRWKLEDAERELDNAAQKAKEERGE